MLFQNERLQATFYTRVKRYRGIQTTASARLLFSLYQAVPIYRPEQRTSPSWLTVSRSVVRSTTQHKDRVSFLPPWRDSYYIRALLVSIHISIALHLSSAESDFFTILMGLFGRGLSVNSLGRLYYRKRPTKRRISVRDLHRFRLSAYYYYYYYYTCI